MERLTITIVVENTAGKRGTLGEHGLAVLVEADGHRILFDTGQGLVLAQNLVALELELNPLTAIALSHGHYDHTGGLTTALDRAGATPIYVHPDALKPKYSPRGAIGMPAAIPPLPALDVPLHWTTQPTEIVPGIQLTGPIPRRHPLEDVGGDFWQNADRSQADTLDDDQALWIESPQGLVVILGCAHAGVMNTLDYIAELTGTTKIYGVLGGMHLLRATPERLEATAAKLRAYDVQLIGANHCTGVRAISFLWQQFPDKMLDCRVGTTLTLARSAQAAHA